MAHHRHYRVALRRRREGKTDYQARKALVLSGRPRIVARNSLKNSSVQIVIAKPVGDVVLAAAHSRELAKYGWKAPTGNSPAAYLTGFLCGLKAKANGVEEAILDIGLVAPTKGSKLFAVLSGVVDAGVPVPHDEKQIVKAMVKGEHIAKYAKSLGAGSEEYSAKFSKYLAEKVAPEKLPELVVKVKDEIAGAFKAGGAKPEPKVKVEVKTEAKKEAEAEPKVKPEPKAKAKAKPKAKAKAKPAAKKPAKKKAVKKSGKKA
jgi:large subunit ribosomal protein L18